MTTSNNMRWQVTAILGVLACMQAQAAAPRLSTAIVARGEHLSRLICAQCHVVAADQTVPPRLEQRTPSFEEIAQWPRTSKKTLRRFITGTHWDMQTIPITMPNPELTDEQVRAVTEYILSLRRQ